MSATVEIQRCHPTANPATGCELWPDNALLIAPIIGKLRERCMKLMYTEALSLIAQASAAGMQEIYRSRGIIPTEHQPAMPICPCIQLVAAYHQNNHIIGTSLDDFMPHWSPHGKSLHLVGVDHQSQKPHIINIPNTNITNL